MDKSWIKKPHTSDEYDQGIKEFINFAFRDELENGEIICPCKRCGFKKPQSRSVMYDHLKCKPFPKGYTIWVHHGESIGETSTISPISISNIVQDTVVVDDQMQNMINDAFGVEDHANEVPIESNAEKEKNASQQRYEEAKEYYELSREGEKPLYEGCVKYSRLSFLVKLYHIKCLCGMTNKAMTMVLELLKDAFEFANIPNSFYEAKKTITKLGLNYEKIPVCPNNCMLYWGNKEDEERETCKICNTSTWKSKAKVGAVGVSGDGNNRKKVPAKVLLIFRGWVHFLGGTLTLDLLAHRVQNIDVTFGRKPDKERSGKRIRGGRPTQGVNQQWKKKSIFFELPYWKDNLLRHNLDMMHIEKNVCDNIIFTLLNDSTKSKDHLNARKDLKAMGIRPDLWPNENGRISPAVFTLTTKGKKRFLTTLKNITVPDGYSSNISRCIDMENLKLNGMLKSHDCHILMEQLLPLAIRATLPDDVSAIMIEFCSLFRQLCSKVLNVDDLEKLQNQVVLTLCHMEMIFPPSFFTVMVHLVVHLVEEVKLGGPVHYRWMYPVERYLGILKSYVRNKARLEGSIAEGYLVQEILTFCSRYIENIETRWNQLGRVDDEPINEIQTDSRVAELFPRVGKSVGGSSYYTVTPIEKLHAHRHILTNCIIVDYYQRQYRSIIRSQMRSGARSTSEVDKKICNNLDNISGSDENFLISLAQGPSDKVRRFTAFNVNGFKFRTLARDNLLKTQNSGFFGMFGTRNYSSNGDAQMRFGGVPYYGRLIDIIEVSYDGFKVPMFKCKWANTTIPRGIKTDKLGFTSINFARLIHTGEHEDDDPYIKASKAQMVYYVDDEKEQGWSIPIHLKPRDLYDMGGDD
ncbi:uncharacterized protein [Cicer arietinum]|uniref:uncharacterized protein n=1 Tax=Cicer arietinum TaxID=3827 RepID=UPI003CC5BCFE